MRRGSAAAAGSLAVAGVAWLLRRRRGREHVEVQYDDGALVRLEPGTTAADDLLALARRALREARAA